MTTIQALPVEDLTFLSLKELAHVLRLAPKSVYRLTTRRLLPVYRVCRRLRFLRSDVLAYLARQRTKAVGDPEV